MNLACNALSNFHSHFSHLAMYPTQHTTMQEPITHDVPADKLSTRLPEGLWSSCVSRDKEPVYRYVVASPILSAPLSACRIPYSLPMEAQYTRTRAMCLSGMDVLLSTTSVMISRSYRIVVCGTLYARSPCLLLS